ncbi:MAG: DUF2911 domain-containing protein [Acidimicrobiia bacterium]|nr:DUF2911 domain-containing protein [Acidimicrobiia bacterium]
MAKWVIDGTVTSLIGLLCAVSLGAQGSGATPNVAPSGRVTTSVAFDGRVLKGRGSQWSWFTGTPAHSGPSRMIVDYGQPHARGRTVFGELVPYGEVWRLGANWATTLNLDVPMRIGELNLPRGEYTLFLLPRRDGGELIVSEETRQWGTDYDPARDFGRTPVRRRDLSQAIESLTITLEPVFPPAKGAVPSGSLRIAWGLAEYSAQWRMLWP